MKLNFKKILLTGTALVAVSAVSSQAQAATQTLTGNVEWANLGTKVAANGDGTAAVAGDTAVMSTFNLTVTNDNTNDDGSANKNTFALGAVTATTGDFVITEGQGALNTVTLASFSSSTGGDFSVTGTDAFTGGITASVTGAATIGGNLSIVNGETNAADAVALSVGGALSVTGTTAITGGAGAFANPASLTVTGNSTFTGAVTVTGGANAAAPATLTLNGATNAFTAGLTLTKGAAGEANLKLSGTTAQTVSGTIAGTGLINIDNASGATFSGTVAGNGITIEKVGGSSSATFQNTVNVGANVIKLGGDAAAGTNTLTLDSTTQAFAVTGAITGTGTEVDNVVVSGGKTVTLNTASGTNLDGLTISGTSTKLTTGVAHTFLTTSIGSGSTLTTTAGTFTGTATTLAGTLNMAGGSFTGTVNGSSAGVGTVDVDNNGTLTGSIGTTTAVALVDIAAGAVLTVTSGGATNINATSTTLGGAGAGLTVTTGAANAITTAITTATDATGALIISDAAFTTTVTGNIGTSTAKLATMDIAGGGANVVTTTGNLYVNAITANDADTLQFLGTSAQTVSGTVAGGIVTVGNGTTASDVTFSGAMTSLATNVTVNTKATARFDANVTGDANTGFVNSGTSYIASGKTVTLSGTGAYSGAGTLYVTAKDDGDGVANVADVGRIVSAAAINTNAGALVINYTGNVVAGTYTILDAGAASAITTNITDNSFQYGTSVALVGQDHVLTVTRSTFVETGTTSNNDSLGTMLETINNTTDTQIAAAIDNIAAQSTQAAANEVMESMIPTVDGGAMVAAATVTSNSFGLMGDRLAALRTEQSGMAAGNGTIGNRLWMQGFGTMADQDHRDGVDGYEADTFGGTIGLDTENIAANGIVGVALSFANTEVDSKNANRTNTDVDSYQIALYGDYDLDQTTWLNGMVAYAWNDASSVRQNVGGIAGLTARGDFDANQFTAQAAVGRDYAYESMILAPSFLAHWTHYDPDGYTETGAGGLNQVVTQDSVDVFELGVGVDATWQYQTASGMEVEPSLHAGYRYDLVGDEVGSTARFTGAGTAFNTNGADPARSAFNVGAGMKLYTTDNWEFSANYDFEFKSDYDAHAGYLRAGVKF